MDHSPVSTPLESFKVRHLFSKVYLIERSKNIQGDSVITAPQAWGEGEDWDKVIHRRFRKQAKKQFQRRPTIEDQPPSRDSQAIMLDQVHMLRKQQTGKKSHNKQKYRSTAAKIYPGLDDGFEKMLDFDDDDFDGDTPQLSTPIPILEPNLSTKEAKLPADTRDLQDTQKELAQLQRHMKSVPEGTLRNAMCETVDTLERKVDRLQVSRRFA